MSTTLFEVDEQTGSPAADAPAVNSHMARWVLSLPVPEPRTWPLAFAPGVGDIGVVDFFAGCGGSMQGLSAIPGVYPVLAANHWKQAILSHSANFPMSDHYRGDIREIHDLKKLPYGEFFWASPECPKWSQARGRKRDFDVSHEEYLPGMEPLRDEQDERSRALMWDVTRYLAGMSRRYGRPVLVGVVENVVDVREWSDWKTWLGEFHKLGYNTRVIALNSMHAQSRVQPWAPQSRDRLYVAYWHKSLGRDPDFDKWLRPQAWCPTCEQLVKAFQWFKKPGADMGRYRSQYLYRCPNSECGNQPIEPLYVPASRAIDWSIRGTKIGDKPLKEFFADKARTQSLGFHPLAPKTLARIRAGIERFARPVVTTAAGNTYDGTTTGSKYFRVRDVGLTPLPAITTTVTEGLAVQPLVVPTEGREGKSASTVNEPMRTQTARRETALAVLPFLMRHYAPPFVAELRGGHSDAREVVDPLATVTASGNHHGLVAPPLDGGMVVRNNGSKGDGGEHCTSLADALRTLTAAGHQSVVTWNDLYAYDSGSLRPLLDAMPTQTTRGGDAILSGEYAGQLPEVFDCEFRMFEPHEIGAGMAFGPNYKVFGDKRAKTRQYGNAVTPNVSECIGAALVECIRGVDLVYGTAAA